MKGLVYRFCRKCGEKWNVSCLDPGPKIYICPKCDWMIKNENKQTENSNGK